MQVHTVTTFVTCILGKSSYFYKKKNRNQQKALVADSQDQNQDQLQNLNMSNLERHRSATTKPLPVSSTCQAFPS